MSETQETVILIDTRSEETKAAEAVAERAADSRSATHVPRDNSPQPVANNPDVAGLVPPVPSQELAEPPAEASKKPARKPRAPKNKAEPVAASRPEEVKREEVRTPKQIAMEKTKVIVKKPFEWQKSLNYTGTVLSTIRGSLEDLVRKKNIRRF